VNGVLIDIGISSPQLDGARGFRPEFDGHLDMRFDVSDHVETALQFLHRVDRHELAKTITEYGGEHPLAAQRIADAIALAKLDGTLPTRTVRKHTQEKISYPYLYHIKTYRCVACFLFCFV
jgi:16S rRNA C1402 N4-methylase RsmH